MKAVVNGSQVRVERKVTKVQQSTVDMNDALITTISGVSLRPYVLLAVPLGDEYEFDYYEDAKSIVAYLCNTFPSGTLKHVTDMLAGR